MTISRVNSLCVILACFLAGCDGLNSQLNLQQINGDKNFGKSKCQFKPLNNCWSDSLALITDCYGEPDEEDQEVFTNDRKICNSPSDKKILFENPLALVAGNEFQPIRFTAYQGTKKCFRFNGTHFDFTIDETPHGSLSVKPMSNGDVRVQCFFGETMTISKSAIENGCQGSKALPSDFLPKASVKDFKSSESSGKAFRFSGTRVGPQSLFQCIDL